MTLMKTALLGASLAAILAVCGGMSGKPAEKTMKGPACATDNAGLTLPDGFCATVFADKLGGARHVAVTDDGTVYVNTWLSPFKGGGDKIPGGFIVALKDTKGDGVADKTERFNDDGGDAKAIGGTGLALYNGYLYAEDTGKIVRFKLTSGEMKPAAAPETILEGLALVGGHTMHSIAISKDGALYVNSGSASNACQVKDRNLHSKGKTPCEEIPTRAGIWKYDANKTGQKFSPAERYVSNIRNTVALNFDPAGDLYAVPHGRDNLYENWPEHFNEQQGSDLPAEMMVKTSAGASYGWPNCYYDPFQKKYILAPEYGGDGKKVGQCAKTPEPVAAYPAHWAPNSMLFYTGTAFPAKYQGGAFIAFHGSWNRKEQQGYNVVFQPFAGGKPSGDYEVFADGFSGPTKSPQGAEHRPTGLAMGPDGALYVSDDQNGRVYRIVHR